MPTLFITWSNVAPAGTSRSAAKRCNCWLLAARSSRPPLRPSGAAAQSARREASQPLLVAQLRRGFLRHGRGRQKIVAEPCGVRIEQFRDALRLRRAQDKPRVIFFRYALHDFRIVIGGSVRSFLPRQRKHHAAIVAAALGQHIWRLAGFRFDARPLAPQIYAGGGFHRIRNECAADARSDFDEVEFAVRVRAQEFGVRDAAHQAQRCDQFAVDLLQQLYFRSRPQKRARGEYASLVRSIERRRAVGVDFRKHHFAFGNDAIHVEHIAGHELLQQVVRLFVAQLLQQRPKLGGGVNFLHADAGSLRARLQQPRRIHARHEFLQAGVVQHVNKFRNVDARFFRAPAHRQLVAEMPHRGEAHAGNAQVFAQRRGVFHIEFIQRDDAVNRLPARHVAHGVYDRPGRQLRRHVEHFVNGFARPIAISEFFHRQQQHAAALVLAGAQKFLAFFVGSDAENRQRARFRHLCSPNICHANAGPNFVVSADYTADSPAGNKNCRKGPTRSAQAASLCCAPSITWKSRSRPSCQPRLSSVSRNAVTFATVCVSSFVPTSSHTRGRAPSGAVAAKSRIARRFHHTDGDSTASLPNTCEYFRPRYIVSSPPSDEPPSPVFAAPSSARYFDSMNGFNSSTSSRPYLSALPPPSF